MSWRFYNMNGIGYTLQLTWLSSLLILTYAQNSPQMTGKNSQCHHVRPSTQSPTGAVQHSLSFTGHNVQLDFNLKDTCTLELFLMGVNNFTPGFSPYLRDLDISCSDSITNTLVQGQAIYTAIESKPGFEYPMEWKYEQDAVIFQILLPRLTANVHYIFQCTVKYYYLSVMGAMQLTVVGCPAGMYGLECNKACPECHNGGECHSLYGYCLCPEGWTGQNCTQESLMSVVSVPAVVIFGTTLNLTVKIVPEDTWNQIAQNASIIWYRKGHPQVILSERFSLMLQNIDDTTAGVYVYNITSSERSWSSSTEIPTPLCPAGTGGGGCNQTCPCTSGKLCTSNNICVCPQGTSCTEASTEASTENTQTTTYTEMNTYPVTSGPVVIAAAMGVDIQTAIIGAVLGFVLLVILILLIVCCVRFSPPPGIKYIPDTYSHSVQKSLASSGDCTLSSSDTNVATSPVLCGGDIFWGRRIGTGSFCKVHEGRLIRDQLIIPIALKICKSAEGFQEEKQHLEYELGYFNKLAGHPYITQLYGVVKIDPDDIPTVIADCRSIIGHLPAAVVVEYMPHGCLHDILISQRQNRQKTKWLLPPKRMVQVVCDVISALAYMHQKQLLHKHVSSKHIYIAHDLAAKIGGFGSSVTSSAEAPRENWRWSGIEILQGHSPSSESDVWSLGVFLWEITTLGQLPYSDICRPQELLAYLVEGGGRLARLPSCSQEWYAIMLQCWSANPINRPQFRTLQDRFNSLSANQKTYPNFEGLSFPSGSVRYTSNNTGNGQPSFGNGRDFHNEAFTLAIRDNPVYSNQSSLSDSGVGTDRSLSQENSIEADDIDNASLQLP